MHTQIRLETLCDRWLKAWTGNDPEVLLAFYAEDCRYLDPAHPAGIEGKQALRRYLVRLLARFPDWEWRRHWLVPAPEGFVLRWYATIPIRGAEAVVIEGMDSVRLDASGLISGNEVFFDARDFPA